MRDSRPAAWLASGVAEAGLVEFPLALDLRKSIPFTELNGYQLLPKVRVLGASTALDTRVLEASPGVAGSRNHSRTSRSSVVTVF